jgi:hypothetical protein
VVFVGGLCCYGVCGKLSLRRLTMVRKKTLQRMFNPIDREEMHVHVEREFGS